MERNEIHYGGSILATRRERSLPSLQRRPPPTKWERPTSIRSGGADPASLVEPASSRHLQDANHLSNASDPITAKKIRYRNRVTTRKIPTTTSDLERGSSPAVSTTMTATTKL